MSDDIYGSLAADYLKRQKPATPSKVAGYKPRTKTSGNPEYDSWYDLYGKENDIDPDLLISQGQQESTFNPKARSPKGATGIAQFMPATAAEFGVNPNDPKSSIGGQAKMMRGLLDRTNDINLALAGYNSGHNLSIARLRRNAERIPETRDYIKKITGYYGQPIAPTDPYASAASDYVKRPQANPTDNFISNYLKRPPTATATLPEQTADVTANANVLGQTPVPESSVALSSQIESLRNPKSSRAAVLLTPGEVPPSAILSDKEYKVFPSKHGALVVNLAAARKMKLRSPDDIQLYIDQNPDAIARLTGKAETADDTSDGHAVQTFNGQGMEIHTSKVTTPEAAREQAKLDRQNFTDAASQKVLPIQKAVENRQADVVKLDNQKQRDEILSKALPGEQPTDTILRLKREPVEQSYKQFLAETGLPDSPDSIAEFNTVQQTIAQQNQASRMPSVAPIQPQTANAPRVPVKPDQSVPVTQESGNGEIVFDIPLTNKPANITYSDWVQDQRAEKLSQQLNVDYTTVRKVLDSFEAKSKYGTANEAYYEGIAKQGDANRSAIGQTVIDKIKEVDARTKKQDSDFKTKLEEYKGELSPDETTSIASIRAAFDAGYLSPDEFLKQLNEEKARVKQYREEMSTGANLDLTNIGQAKLGNGKVGKDFDAQAVTPDTQKALEAIIKDYGTLSAYAKEQDRLREEYKYRPLAHPIEFAKNFAGALPKAVASMLKTADIVNSVNPLTLGYDVLSGRGYKIDETALSGLSDSINKYLESVRNKDLQGSTVTTVLPDTLGQLAVQMAAGVLTGGASLPTAIGASMGAAAQYDEAKKFTTDDKQKLLAATVGALAAVPDALMFGKWFKGASEVERTGFFKKVTRSLMTRLGVRYGDDVAEEVVRPAMTRFINNTLKGAGFEGVQEVSENKINDWLALKTYDPSAERSKKLYSINDEDVMSFVGGFIGGAAGGVIETFSELEPKAQDEFIAQANAEVDKMLERDEIKPAKAVEVKAEIAQVAEQVKTKKPKKEKVELPKSPASLGSESLVQDKPVEVPVEAKAEAPVEKVKVNEFKVEPFKGDVAESQETVNEKAKSTNTDTITIYRGQQKGQESRFADWWSSDEQIANDFASTTRGKKPSDGEVVSQDIPVANVRKTDLDATGYETIPTVAKALGVTDAELRTALKQGTPTEQILSEGDGDVRVHALIESVPVQKLLQAKGIKAVELKELNSKKERVNTYMVLPDKSTQPVDAPSDSVEVGKGEVADIDSATSKTNLDLILDRVTNENEVTLSIKDGISRDQIRKVEDAAKARGMTAAFDGHGFLIRKNIEASPKQDVGKSDAPAQLSAKEQAKALRDLGYTLPVQRTLSDAQKADIIAKGIKKQDYVATQADVEATPKPDVLDTTSGSVEANTSEQARKDGKLVRDGVEYIRQEPLKDVPSGKAGKIRFADAEPDPAFTFKLIEADNLQSADLGGNTNYKHFIPEAQPKDRSTDASKVASDKIAKSPDLDQVSDSPNAYSGAPVVNARGEVIQGNNRSEGLKKHYTLGGTSYKQDLATNAERFGLTPEQVKGMKNPVLVREVDVDDDSAIRLGQYKFSDLESGGQVRIDPVTTARRIPHAEKGRMLKDVFQDAPDDATLAQLIRANKPRITKHLYPYLTNTQKETMENSAKEFKPEAIKDIEGVLRHFLFDKGETSLPDYYENLPFAAKQAITASLPKIFSVEQNKSIVPELQKAITAASRFQSSRATDFETWAKQPDLMEGRPAPVDAFSDIELEIARRLVTAKTQKELKDLFALYAKLANGDEATMFRPANEPLSKADALDEVLSTDKPLRMIGGSQNSLPLEYEAVENKVTQSPELDGIIGSKGQIDYDKAKDVAGRIQSGSLTIERLDPEAERGRLAGGSRAIEASVLLAADEQSRQAASQRGRSNVESRSDTRQRQEKLLENYAKREGIWYDWNKFFRDKHFTRGGEAFVYRQDNNHVAKTIDYRKINGGMTPQQFIDDRIALFNHLFPETKYELMGFTKDPDGKFRFLVKQPFIDVHGVSRADVNAAMKVAGFDYAGYDIYKSPLYYVSDIHEKNAAKDAKGNIFVIDAVPKLAEEAAYQPFKVVSNDTPLRSIFPNAHPDEIAAVEAAGVEVDREGNLKRWFGDSKVVDEKGNPLRVYRGDVENKQGIFFTSSTDTAEGYTRSTFFRGGDAPQTTAVYLSLQNPLIIDALGKRNDNIPVPWSEWKPKVFGNLPDTAVSVEDAYAYALKNGYDGLIVRNVVDTADPTERAKPSDVYAVKEQNQVKSAIGNNGNFDPAEDSILRSINASVDANMLGTMRQDVPSITKWITDHAEEAGYKVVSVSDVSQNSFGKSQYVRLEGQQDGKAFYRDVRVSDHDMGAKQKFYDAVYSPESAERLLFPDRFERVEYKTNQFTTLKISEAEQRPDDIVIDRFTSKKGNPSLTVKRPFMSSRWERVTPPLFKIRSSEDVDALYNVLPYIQNTGDLLEFANGGTITDGELELSPYDAEVTRRLLAEVQKGTDVPASEGAVYNASTLNKMAKVAEAKSKEMTKMNYPSSYTDNLDNLAKNLKTIADNAKYGILYTFEESLPEERFHLEDLSAGRTSQKAIEQMKQSPLWDASEKFNRDYGKLSDRDKASEIVAKLATGQEKAYGWDKIDNFETERADLFDTWIEGVIAQNNIKDIDAFNKEFTRLGAVYAEAKTNNSRAGKETIDGAAGVQASTPESETETRGQPEESERVQGGAVQEGEIGSNRNPGKSGLPSDPAKVEEARIKGQKVAAFSRILGQESYYDPQTHEQTEVKAQQLLSDKGVEQAVWEALNGTPSAEGMKVVYWELERLNGLADHYLETGETAAFSAVAEEIADLSTKIIARQIAGGQETEIAKTILPLSPEAAILTATRMVQYAKGDPTAGLTEGQTKQIVAIAKDLKETAKKLAEETAARKKLEREVKRLRSDRGPTVRTPQAKMLKEFEKNKPQIVAQLADLFPNSPMFNGAADAVLNMTQGVLRSSNPPEVELSPEQSDVLTQYAVGLILEGKTYNQVIDTLESIAGTDVRGIHAKAVETIKPSKPMTDEAKERVKTRNEHYKAAEAYLHPNAKAERALEATKKRLQKQIDSLEQEIKAGKEVTKAKPAPLTDAEIDALKVRRDALKARHDEIFGKGELTPAQKAERALDAVKKRLQKQIAKLNEEIAAGKVEVKKKTKLTSPEIAALERQRDEIRKRHDEIFATEMSPEKRAALAEKAVERSIEALEKQIATGQRDVKQSPVIESEKLKELKGQREELRKRFDEMFPTDLTPEQRVKIAEKALERSIQDIERQLQAGRPDGKKPSKTPDTPHLKELKAARAELRKQLRDISLSGIAQDALDMGESPEMVFAVDRLTGDKPKNLNDVIRDIQQKFGMNVDAAGQLGRKAYALTQQIRANRQRLADEKQGKLPEQRIKEAEARTANLASRNRMINFLKRTAPTPWLVERFNNDFRAKLVSNWGTQIFNAVQGIASTTMESVTDFLEALVKMQVSPNPETTVDIDLKDLALPMAYAFSKNKQVGALALSNFADQYFQVHAGLLGDIELDNQPIAPTVEGLRKYPHQWFDANDKLNQWLSKWSGAKMQEMHFRNAIIAATFDQIIRRKSGRKETLLSALENGTILDYITEQEAQIAADKALRVTFASMIDDPVGKQLKRAYDQIDKILPVMLNPVTFARFTYTTTKVMVANPLLFGAMDSAALGGKGYNARSIAKGITAWAGVAVAYGLLSAFGDDDDRWETITINGVTIDVRRFFPLSAYFYVAHLIKNGVEGRPILPSLKDLAEGFASLETDYFTNSAAMNLVGDTYEYTQGRKSGADIGAGISGVLGSFLSGFLRPIKPFKDVLAQFDSEEAKLREYDTGKWDQSFVKELSKTVPLIGRFAPEQKDALTGEPIMTKAPLARWAGVNVVHPSFLNAKQTPATEWAEKVFTYTPTSEWTNEEKQAFYIRKRLKNAVWRGQVQPAELNGLIQKYVQDGKLTSRSASTLRDDLKLSELQLRLKYGYKPGDKPNPAMNRKLQVVMNAATAAEKDDIQDVIGRRINKQK